MSSTSPPPIGRDVAARRERLALAAPDHRAHVGAVACSSPSTANSCRSMSSSNALCLSTLSLVMVGDRPVVLEPDFLGHASPQKSGLSDASSSIVRRCDASRSSSRPSAVAHRSVAPGVRVAAQPFGHLGLGADDGDVGGRGVVAAAGEDALVGGDVEVGWRRAWRRARDRRRRRRTPRPASPTTTRGVGRSADSARGGDGGHDVVADGALVGPVGDGAVGQLTGELQHLGARGPRS